MGDQIEVLTNNGSQSNPLKLQSYNASVLVALAYDPSAQKLFFSDKRNRRGHVFSVNFDGIKTEGLVHDVVESNFHVNMISCSCTNIAVVLDEQEGEMNLSKL